MSDDTVRWPRVKELLTGIMARWKQRMGREGLPGIHHYHWDTPSALAKDRSMGRSFIEPGVPAEETPLIVALRRGFGSIPRMPMNGPFLKDHEIDEIAAWIDSGRPE